MSRLVKYLNKKQIKGMFDARSECSVQLKCKKQKKKISFHRVTNYDKGTNFIFELYCTDI